MRRGTVRRKCSTCGIGVKDGKVCRNGHDSIVWSYVVDVAPEGAPRKQRTKSGYKTKKEAVAALAQVQVEAERGDLVDPSKLTLSAYLTDKWLPTVEAKYRPSTYSSYADVCRLYLIPHLGDVPVQSLTPDLLTRTYGTLEREGGKNGASLSKRTVRYAHNVLGKALKDAARWKLIRSNPAPLADPPTSKQTQSATPKAWTADQLRTFFGSLEDDRMRPLWWFFATTGVRRGEAAGLRWENVDLEAGAVSIVETRSSVNYQVVEGAPKTAKGRRRIALDPLTVDVLKAWRKTQLEERMAYGAGWTDTGHVFTREDGEPWHPDRVSKMFNRAVAAADLPKIPVHGLRHTSASVALANGVPLKVVSDRLGHSSIAITGDVYSHVTEGQDRDAAETIAKRMMGGN